LLSNYIPKETERPVRINHAGGFSFLFCLVYRIFKLRELHLNLCVVYQKSWVMCSLHEGERSFNFKSCSRLLRVYAQEFLTQGRHSRRSWRTQNSIRRLWSEDDEKCH
jgi:hypothetical protein